MEDALLGLTSLELHLFIAVLHIHGRTQHHGGASSGGSGGSGVGGGAAALGTSSQPGAPAVMKVANVFMLCDMLVEVFKQNVSILSFFLANINMQRSAICRVP